MALACYPLALPINLSPSKAKSLDNPIWNTFIESQMKLSDIENGTSSNVDASKADSMEPRQPNSEQLQTG